MEIPARPSRIPMAEWRERVPKVPGTIVSLAIDEFTPGADFYGGVITVPPGGTVPVHWHAECGELQFVLFGSGVLLGADGDKAIVGPHDLVFSPAGASGAHGFRNTSSDPLVMLFFYASPGGVAPDIHRVEGSAPG